jgi:hypothetical protein
MEGNLPTSCDRAIRRHDLACPELKPGQLVTWKDVISSGRRARPAQGSLFPHRRSPDRQRSIERRRRLAASGPMPPALAAHFTTGQLSVLRIVSDEIRDRRRCTLYVDEIAARAGVSRRHAQGAIREAEELGYVRVTERRLTGTRNDSNIVVIVSAEWLAWLAMGKGLDAKNCRARPSTFRSLDPRAVDSVKEEERSRANRAAKWSGGVEFASSVPRSP